MNKDRVINKLRSYKGLKADVKSIEFNIEEIEEEIGLTGLSTEEKTGKTYKVTSSTEQQALHIIEEKEELLFKKYKVEREIKRIENALTVLNDDEREVLVLAHIEQKKWYSICEKFDRSYARLKQLEGNALEKLKKYL